MSLVTEGLITLYQLDTTRIKPGDGQIYYFASATDADTSIFWGGQEYAPLPMEATGFEMTTRGAIPQPNVTISNLFGAGNLLLDTYNGLIGATLIRILTLRRFLDDGATPDSGAYISRDVFVVAQKTSHNAMIIVFKLAARIDQEGTQLPRRQILGTLHTPISSGIRQPAGSTTRWRRALTAAVLGRNQHANRTVGRRVPTHACGVPPAVRR